jgi:hypothetical protein
VLEQFQLLSLASKTILQTQVYFGKPQWHQ